jgi:hypothetical protein
MGVTVTTDGDGDNNSDVRVHNTRAPLDGDLKLTPLDPTTGSTGTTITPGTDSEVGATTSAQEFIVTSNTSAQAMLVTCKVNNHGGGDANVHCIGVRSTG